MNQCLNTYPIITEETMSPAFQSNFLHVAPPLLGFLIASPAADPALFGEMRDILAAAAPVGVSLIEKFKQKAPNVVVREGWLVQYE